MAASSCCSGSDHGFQRSAVGGGWKRDPPGRHEGKTMRDLRDHAGRTRGQGEQGVHLGLPLVPC